MLLDAAEELRRAREALKRAAAQPKLGILLSVEEGSADEQQ
jgi:hypothetical protein